MTAKQLTDSILQMAIQGKLVPQDPNDEPASVLLERIREEKRRLVTEGKIKKKDLDVLPITEDEIPYDVPNGWVWCRVKDISESFIGLTYKPTDVSPNGWIVLRSSNIKDGLLDLKDVVKVNVDVSEKLRVRRNDIIICARNGSKKLVGKSALVREVSEPMTFGAFMAICRSHFYEYMSKYLLSPLFFQQLRKDSDTTTINQLTQKNFNNYLVPLPPLAEQHRIVERIEEYLPIIKEYGEAYEEASKMDAELPDKLKKSILQEAIMGKLGTQDPSDAPASCLLDDIRAEKQNLVREGKLKRKDLTETPVEEDEAPFNIPETWMWIRFGDLVSTSTGKTPARGEVVYWNSNDYPWVSISDMKQGEVVNSTKEFISKKAAADCFHNEISKGGTLIMSFKLTVGRTSILGMDAYHNEAIISIKTYADNDNYTRDYLAYILPIIANSGDSKDAIKGKTLNSKSIYNLLVPLPPLAEQHRIVKKIEELYAEIDNMTVENNININETEETEKD